MDGWTNRWLSSSGIFCRRTWWLLRDDFNSAIRTLEGSGLVYDILIWSDWPVCLAAAQYRRRWFDVLHEYFEGFSRSEQDKVFGETAIEVYQLR